MDVEPRDMEAWMRISAPVLNHVYIYPSAWVVILRLCGPMWQLDYAGGYLSPE